MRRSILLVLAVALAVLVFAPVAAAQSDDMGQDDHGMDDRGFDDRGMDDNATAIPTSSASAMGSASATSSATVSASASSATSSATAAPSNVLPDTGGISLIPVLSAAVLALLIGSGVVATILARRTS